MDFHDQLRIITSQEEAEALGGRILGGRFSLFDVALDDSSYIQDVTVVGNAAVGVITGGHSGFVYFYTAPQVFGRYIQHALRISKVHRIPFFGSALRRKWAGNLGVIGNVPTWLPKL